MLGITLEADEIIIFIMDGMLFKPLTVCICFFF